MSTTINTNNASINSQRHLGVNQEHLAKPMERLSSGLRINSAKDDAAGLAIAARFTEQVLGSGQAIRNTSDGVSLAQTAEGAVQEISGNLQRMRELALQSSNATISSSDRQSLQNEFQSLQQEIGRVAEATEFNGVKVIGNNQSLTFQVGPNAGSENQVTVSTVDVRADAGVAPAITSANITSAGGSYNALNSVDSAINRISAIRADFGSVQTRFESTIRSSETTNENLSAARSRIQDADYAQETANRTRASIIQHANQAMLGQANVRPQLVLSLLQP